MDANLSKGKSNKSTTNSFAELFDPLIANIISLLPIKSVLCCRTVCKAWHQSIAGINFNGVYQKGEDNAYMSVVTRSPCNEYNLFEFNMKSSMFESAAPVNGVQNGVLHWICRCIDDETILDWIYCFDCETEKLSSLHPPSDCSHFHQSKLVTFMVLRNYMCLVHLFDDDIVLWLMEYYGEVAESWTKMSFHNQFHEPSQPPKPLILREDKNLLFLEWCSGSFCYYDDDKKVYVNSRTALRKTWNLYAFCYIPSFVPLLEVFKKNPSKVIIQHSGWLGSILNVTGLRKTQ